MAYYDEQGFSQMQREALERMRDMQKRSKSLVFEQDEPKSAPPAAETSAHNAPQNHQHKQHHNPPHVCKQNDALTSLFSGGANIDSEKLLILILLFMLYKNNADIKLILALGYLLI